MTGVRTVRFVVPADIDDPARVSGGNVYDRHLRGGLRRLGWEVQTIEVADRSGRAAALEVEPGALVLVDGLVAGWAPDALEAAADRAADRRARSHGRGCIPRDNSAGRRGANVARSGPQSQVIATSRWTASEFVRLGLVSPDRVAVAVPGAHDRAIVTGPVGHRDLLCVGAIAPHKGQDLLLDALAMLPDRDWTCTLAGSTTAHPAFTARVADAADRFGGRVRMTGVLDGAELDRAYRRCGVLVAPSRVESFGMAIGDARRRAFRSSRPRSAACPRRSPVAAPCSWSARIPRRWPTRFGAG